MKVKTFKNHSVKTESSSTVSSSTGQNMFIALAGDKTEQKSKRGDVAATGVKINNSCRNGIDLLNFIVSLIHFRPCCHTLLACLFSFAFCLLEGMNSLSDSFSQLLPGWPKACKPGKVYSSGTTAEIFNSFSTLCL